MKRAERIDQVPNTAVNGAPVSERERIERPRAVD